MTPRLLFHARARFASAAGRAHVRRTLGAVVFVAAAALAPPPERYVLDPAGSRFWIDGTSTMGRYTCRAARLDGSGTLDEATAPRGRAELRVEVRSFDCGQAQMNRDFRNALRASAHPRVTLTVERASVRPAAAGGRTVAATATGTLRLAGVSRPLTFEATARPLGGGRYRVEGQHALKMTDFGVPPPTGLMGLVRAHDRVVARFDVVLREE